MSPSFCDLFVLSNILVPALHGVSFISCILLSKFSHPKVYTDLAAGGGLGTSPLSQSSQPDSDNLPTSPHPCPHPTATSSLSTFRTEPVAWGQPERGQRADSFGTELAEEGGKTENWAVKRSKMFDCDVEE